MPRRGQIRTEAERRDVNAAVLPLAAAAARLPAVALVQALARPVVLAHQGPANLVPLAHTPPALPAPLAHLAPAVAAAMITVGALVQRPKPKRGEMIKSGGGGVQAPNPPKFTWEDCQRM